MKQNRENESVREYIKTIMDSGLQTIYKS